MLLFLLTYPDNGTIAYITVRCKLHVIAALAVQVVRLLDEAFILKRFSTASAVEVLRMPVATKCTEKRAPGIAEKAQKECHLGFSNSLLGTLRKLGPAKPQTLHT